ncbi:hypothetical protein FQN54_006053 [Arachnomyces sp. PD_36]|nr:hypothetical protein FQN54_006053 [Arachnomyces sp. PD_36]
MARRYQTDELLRLSASPLAVKPDSLPPAEEWMGPIPDPATLKKNTHGRDNSNQETTTGRRPSVFENRHTSRGSEDIILGPPKTSFASASARILGKSIDLNDKAPATNNDSDDIKNERYNFRDKFFKDREFGDKDSDKRDTRVGGGPGRRGGRDDREDWGGGRQRRTFGSDEIERKPRRNGDSDRWGMGGREDHRDQRDNRDHRDRDQDRDNDRGARDKETGRFLPRQDRQGRGRHEQSWFRDDGAQEPTEIEEDKRTMRNREWRQNRGNHGHDREWHRGAKFEQDPEWMDSTDRDDTKQAHTQEDFQRWKERMKAGSGQAPPPEEKKEPVVESGNGSFWQDEEPKRADGELFSNVDTMDNSGLDKFFGLWGDSKAGKDAIPSTQELESKKDAAPAKAQKASRFAGIFSPPAETQNQQPEPPVAAKPRPERPASGDADQEGFQRILQMLGGNKSRNTTPQADATMQPRPPPPQAQAEQSMPPMFPSPPRDAGNRHEYMPFQESSPRNRGHGNMDSIQAPRPQKEAAVHNRDSDLLLQLMQQAKISPSANSQQGGSHPSTAGHTPGVLNVPDLLSRPQGVQKQRTPTFLDDPAIANMQRPDSNELRDQARRRVNNAPPMGYFDDVPASAAQNNQVAAEANKMRLQGPAQGQSSVGLQRPPGFEQMPPPGWPNPQMPPPPQQAGPNPLGPPPGIPNPSRNMNPGFPPGPMPMHGGMPPPQNERPPLSRNVGSSGTPGSSASFGPPPGMGAPPGYMNMHGPPPSFPPMGNAPEPMPRAPYGNQMYFGGGGPPPPPPQQQQQPPQQSRHPLDMFGGGGNDANPAGRLGAGMMGGPYR